MSNDRQAEPIERAARLENFAGSARITPTAAIPAAARCDRASFEASVALVEVADLEALRVPEVALQVVTHLEVVLGDLRGGVAHRPGVVGKGEDGQLRVGPTCRLIAARVRGGRLRVLGDEADEPGVVRQPALLVRDAELRGAGLAGGDDRQVPDVVAVPVVDDLSSGLPHLAEHVRWGVESADQRRPELLDDLAI